ncbi:DUF5985 family protein [Asticcacaulis solisilvae]|uniref:DUF5985 family protein n=1 Tax=Asticcacaulis solisilvae TaxID=1217274 RepID=UPI003FD8509E
MLKMMLLGAIAMAAFTIALIFVRFWRTTRDRFFLFFAAAFVLMGAGRIVLGAVPHSDDQTPVIYLIQLLAFVVILFAVVDKNRRTRKGG